MHMSIRVQRSETQNLRLFTCDIRLQTSVDSLSVAKNSLAWDFVGVIEFLIVEWVQLQPEMSSTQFLCLLAVLARSRVFLKQ